jgi:FAD/FMN-containing dehydrogenase/Fe-S oxidoreductase
VSDLQRELERTIEGEVRFDRISRALYSTDASVYQIEPLGVVIPKSSDDVVHTVLAARAHGCSITARGGGTSQAGQAIGAGLQLDTTKYLNRILEVDASARTVWVEPGLVLDELNAHLRPLGLRFAPDISTASRATIGGMIANNSSGARSVLYGKTIDHVAELQVVLADGTSTRLRQLDAAELEAICAADTFEAACYRIVRDVSRSRREEIERRFPRVLRRVGGYNLDEFSDPARPFNLSRIVVGSEGTLALVVAAKLMLVPLPRAKAVLAIEFEGLLDALAATPLILRHRPSAVELMDRFILDHARDSPALDALRRAIVQDGTGALLCVEMYADDTRDLPPRLDALEQDIRAAGWRCRSRRATDMRDQAQIWSFREASLGLSMAMKGDAKSLSFVEDTAVAPEKLRDYIDRFLQIVKSYGTNAGVYAHASVGCLHVRPVVNLKTEEGVARFAAIANDISDLVLEFGGALSGEHGDGLVRGPFTEKMFGPVLYEAFRSVKRTFDPQGIFNPGKIVDAPPLTANLRYGPTYRTPDPPTLFDYTDHGGLGRAVEMCSGLGACRKKLDGTMCPSYMATLEEKHSTRGRANALRLAMAGRLSENGLGYRDVYEVLDLCLECRACKAECPVGVDVSRFKSEFLADYWAQNGVPVGVRAVGHINRLLNAASFAPGFANALARSAAGRWAAEVVLGIDRRRTLPPLAAKPFAELAVGFSPRDRQTRTGPARTAVLFNDTFTNYCHPAVGMAALNVLDAFGIRVRLVPHACCGRPLISKGLLQDAKALAARNAQALYAFAAAGEPIVFLEPSCLSAIREDSPDLLTGDDKRKASVVAAAAIMFEECVDREWSTTGMPLRQGPREILLHGHCHQKAMGLMPALRSLAERIPGSKSIDLDAGCCGMAGSFGYAREHYDVSQKIGERRLFPAARAMTSDAVLIASGTSCREQVAHFTGVRALHPAELLKDLIEDCGDLIEDCGLRNVD